MSFRQGINLSDQECPFFCLLEDDALVTGFSVTTDSLLAPRAKDEVNLLIHVRVRGTRTTWSNMEIIG